jgi:hypothetical protein
VIIISDYPCIVFFIGPIILLDGFLSNAFPANYDILAKFQLSLA